MGIIGRFVANKVGEKVVLPAAAKLAEKPVERYEKKQKKKHEQFYAAKEDKKVLLKSFSIIYLAASFDVTTN